MSFRDFLITPNWPAPKEICAYTTTRAAGVSRKPYDSLNLADHVGDEIASVVKNRAILRQELNLPNEPTWLTQVHNNSIIDLSQSPSSYDADGSYFKKSDDTTTSPVCVILTADCLPILICNLKGTEIAALHAGWRGILHGIITNGIAKFESRLNELLVFFGPAIGPESFEVGNDVYEAFVQKNPSYATSFIKASKTSWLCNLYQLARTDLEALGITQIFGGDLCTFKDPKRFYSHRHDHGQTGRMASLIWIDSLSSFNRT